MNKHAATICPHCNYKVDASTDVTSENRYPRKGDISICINCGGYLEYSDDLLNIIKMSDDTLSSLGPKEKALLLETFNFILKMKFCKHKIYKKNE